jgi:hypothetical protein
MPGGEGRAKTLGPDGLIVEKYIPPKVNELLDFNVFEPNCLN